jgi:WD40 repeat protein
MQPKAANSPKESGKPLVPSCQIARLRIGPDGKRLVAAGTDALVHQWKLDGKDIAELPPLKGHNGWVTGLAFTKDLLITSDSWGRLSAWSADSKQKWTVEAAHDGWLRMIAEPADHGIATCGKDGFVRLWNPADGKKLAEFDLKVDLLAVRFSPDGKTLFTGDLFGTIREHELQSGKVLRSFEAKELYKLDRIQDVGGVRCLLFDGAGKTLIVGGAVPSTGGFVQCTPLIVAFDRGGKRLWQWKGASDNEGYITDLAWHPDGYLIASASGQPGQGKVFFLKPGDATPFFVSPKPNVHSVALSPDGTRLAAALTNANSSGNGRVKGTGGEYPANNSPIQFWDTVRP